VSPESAVITSANDAAEEWDVAVVDLPGDFLQTKWEG